MHQEIIHTPFFLHVPGVDGGTRCSALCQTIDLAPTLLDWFGVDADVEMDGRSLLPVVRDGAAGHAYALFGAHGNHVCVTDGDYVYMRAAAREDNEPSWSARSCQRTYAGFFTRAVQLCRLVTGCRFTNGWPYLKCRSRTYMNSYTFGSSFGTCAQGRNASRTLRLSRVCSLRSLRK